MNYDSVVKRFYRYRRTVTLAVHAFLIACAYFSAFALRFEFDIPHRELLRLGLTLPVLLVLRAVTFQRFGLFRDYWRHVGLRDLINLIWAVTVSSVLFAFLLVVLGQVPGMSRAVMVLDWLLAVFLVGGLRFAIRVIRETNSRGKTPQRRQVFIIGAGEAGEQLLRQMHHDRRGQVNVVGFIDDDPDTHTRALHGVPVLGGTASLKRLVIRHGVEELVIAIPSVTTSQLRRIVERCAETGLPVKTLPPLQDQLSCVAEVGQLREVRIEDLLGREPVRLDAKRVEEDLADKAVLITGGAGSIGSELARQIAGYHPKRIVLLDRCENTLYFVWLELRRLFPALEVTPVIASITNRRRLSQVFRAHRPDYVFHAAAYKHVPLCEANIVEAAWNNIVGTLRVVECAARYASQKFVLISTDKAVNPTSVLGATKRVAERVALEGAYLASSETEFRAVRFGNVLGSDGSVLPLFRRQLAEGGPLTVTHRDVKRYFMTIPEAVQLLLQAATLPEAAGKIAMLEMGEQVRIVDLAEQLVRLSGLVPYRDIKIDFIGLRPGEKLVEELVGAFESTRATSIEKVRVIEREPADSVVFREGLKQLVTVMKRGEEEALVRRIADLVPEYSPSYTAQSVVAMSRTMIGPGDTPSPDDKQDDLAKVPA